MSLNLSRRCFLLTLASASVAPVVAGSTSAKEEQAIPFLLSDPYRLDLQKAKLLIPSGVIDAPNVSPSADLSMFKRVTPDAVKYLSQYQYGVVDIGVDCMDLELARSLAGWESVTHFTFNHLIDLQPECAQVLCQGSHSLSFPRLNALTADTASELATNQGWLNLSLAEISSDVAYELAKHERDMLMNLNAEPSADTCSVLARHKGDYLEVTFRQPLSRRVIAAMSSNPDKKIFLNPNAWTSSWAVVIRSNDRIPAQASA